MNEQTEKLIRELAEKLGTTVEHLWDVLTRQALISGVTDVVLWVGFATGLVISYRLLKRHSQEWSDELGVGLAWAVWVVFLSAFVINVSINAETIMAAFFNPEYWGSNKY